MYSPAENLFQAGILPIVDHAVQELTDPLENSLMDNNVPVSVVDYVEFLALNANKSYLGYIGSKKVINMVDSLDKLRQRWDSTVRRNEALIKQLIEMGPSNHQMYQHAMHEYEQLMARAAQMKARSNEVCAGTRHQFHYKHDGSKP